MTTSLRKIARQLDHEVRKRKTDNMFEKLMTDKVYRARVKRHVFSPSAQSKSITSRNLSNPPHQAFLSSIKGEKTPNSDF